MQGSHLLTPLPSHSIVAQLGLETSPRNAERIGHALIHKDASVHPGIVARFAHSFELQIDPNEYSVDQNLDLGDFVQPESVDLPTDSLVRPDLFPWPFDLAIAYSDPSTSAHPVAFASYVAFVQPVAFVQSVAFEHSLVGSAVPVEFGSVASDSAALLVEFGSVASGSAALLVEFG